ncbi:MAG: hypothetical protein ACI84O_000521 [Myxococcota bacterium]|jgi:hypothetical protein
MFISLVSLFLSAASIPQQDGLILVGPSSSTDTFLLDNNGTEVHTWTASTYQPGQASYLTESGHLIRTVRVPGLSASSIGGSGGGVEIYDYNDVLISDFFYATNDHLLHHDIAVMPNGNILMIAWEKILDVDVISAGRDAAITGPFMWSESILEVDMTTGSILWEWHAIDHMVQDRDATKPNYGVIADNQTRLDINQPTNLPNANDWLHFNAIDYNADLDQIALSSRVLSEIFIIDHDTTTAQAAGIGGDFLYRWGNPENYDRGGPADRMLQSQHDIQWIASGSPGAGNLIVFNNGRSGPSAASTIDEFTPPLDPITGTYAIGLTGAYGPTSLAWTYDPTPSFFGSHTSGCQRQPNGNTLICNGPAGELFEVDPAGNTVFNWAYSTTSNPGIFKVRRYQTSLFQDKNIFHANTGDAVDFDLAAGSMNAGRPYVIAGTMSGASPGETIGGLHIPINIDAFTSITRSAAYSSFFLNFQGNLDLLGNATAQLVTGPIPAGYVGRTMHFAYVLLSPLDYSSNATPVEIVL